MRYQRNPRKTYHRPTRKGQTRIQTIPNKPITIQPIGLNDYKIGEQHGWEVTELLILGAKGTSKPSLGDYNLLKSDIEAFGKDKFDEVLKRTQIFGASARNMQAKEILSMGESTDYALDTISLTGRKLVAFQLGNSWLITDETETKNQPPIIRFYLPIRQSK